jgi:hypothetical protein
MKLFWIFFGLAVLVVLGSALMLLSTARKPKIPEGVKPQPYDDE